MVRIRANQNNGFNAFSTGYILLGVLGFGILYFVVDKISLDGGIHFGKSVRYDEQQKKTLWKFYEDLGGDDWKLPRSTYKKPWREEEEVCTWSGIVCDDPDSGIVTSISFMRKNLKGTIPTEIGLLTSLKVLAISHEFGVGGTIPTEIGNLVQLDRLQLNVNNLHGSIPKEIGKIEKLLQLIVSQNRLTGTLPSTFANLLYLEKAYMYGNYLTGKADKDSMVCNMRDYMGGSLYELWMDCDDMYCDCCTKCPT